MNFHYLQPDQLIKHNPILAKSDTLYICDSNTAEYCLNLIGHLLPVLVIAPGENHKNLQTVETIIQAMIDHGMSKSSVLVNVGGGLVCDTGGFAASIFQRGINYINIPTTLMAMADAAIGGKTGVNFNHLKNYIGTFQLPLHTYICTPFLKTLTQTEFMSGFAEIIKHNILCQNTWDLLKLTPNNLTSDQLEDLISKSNQFKWGLTQQDFHDKGIRKTLNFGHTLGHALESTMLEKRAPITHGAAVAEGMLMELYLSYLLLGFPAELLNQYTQYISSIYPRIPLQEDDFQKILSFVAKDKKNATGIIHFSLLDEGGICRYDLEVTSELILEALIYYTSLQ